MEQAALAAWDGLQAYESLVMIDTRRSAAQSTALTEAKVSKVIIPASIDTDEQGSCFGMSGRAGLVCANQRMPWSAALTIAAVRLSTSSLVKT